MKTCPACGHSELDGSHFCDACGADLSATPADTVAAAVPPAPEVPAPPAAPEPAVSAPPAAAAVPAPPVYAPSAPAAPAAPVHAPPVPAAAPTLAPPAYAPPAMAPPVAAAPRSTNWMPWVIGAIVVVVLAVGGYFAYTTIFSGPMTAADYKAKALMYLGQIENAGSETSATLQLISSTDPAERAQANAAWDTAAAQTRTAMAGIRGLRPPAEFQSIQDRLVKGVDATEKVIVVTDTLYSMLASGEINSSSPADTPAIKAFTDVASDTTIAAALSDFTAAYNELKSQ